MLVSSLAGLAFVNQFAVHAALLLHEAAGSVVLQDLAFSKHHYAIRVRNGVETMSDGEGSAVLDKP